MVSNISGGEWHYLTHINLVRENRKRNSISENICDFPHKLTGRRLICKKLYKGYTYDASIGECKSISMICGPSANFFRTLDECNIECNGYRKELVL